MHPCKALGPDGISAIFFYKFWEVVRRSVIMSALDMLSNRASLTNLNHTFISLILKLKKPNLPSEFCPISLCNISLKIITKTIVNQLKLCLPNLIEQCQSAFTWEDHHG